MWPGPPVTSNDIRSTYFQKYEKGWSLDNRVDRIMSWLDLEDLDRPQFICGRSLSTFKSLSSDSNQSCEQPMLQM